MAPGTRTPNERLNSESCAGLPRDLYARLAGETVARLRDVFCLRATAEADASTQPMDTEAKAFNSELYEHIRISRVRITPPKTRPKFHTFPFKNKRIKAFYNGYRRSYTPSFEPPQPLHRGV